MYIWHRWAGSGDLGRWLEVLPPPAMSSRRVACKPQVQGPLLGPEQPCRPVSPHSGARSPAPSLILQQGPPALCLHLMSHPELGLLSPGPGQHSLKVGGQSPLSCFFLRWSVEDANHIVLENKRRWSQVHPHSASEADQTVHRVRGGPVNLYWSPFAEPGARGGLIRGLSLACTGGSRGRGVPRGGATPAPGGPAPRGVRGHRGLRCHRRDAGTWHHAHVYALTMFGDSEVGPCRGHATASGQPEAGSGLSVSPPKELWP